MQNKFWCLLYSTVSLVFHVLAAAELCCLHVKSPPRSCSEQKKKIIQPKQAQERSGERTLFSDWPRQWEGSDHNLSLSSVNQGGLFSSFPVCTGAAWIWLCAPSLWAGTVPACHLEQHLENKNKQKKQHCFSYRKQIFSSFWKCFQAFWRTAWKSPISSYRLFLLFSYMLPSSTTTNRYCFALNSFGSKILRISVFVSFDLVSCHSLTHVRHYKNCLLYLLEKMKIRAQCSMHIVIANEIMSHQRCFTNKH